MSEQQQSQPRIPPIDPAEATGKVAALFAAANDTLGLVPNLLRSLAASPEALEAYLALDKLIAEGSFTAAEQQALKLYISQRNACSYCVAAHCWGGRAAGLDDAELARIRRGEASDPKLAALLAFTARVMDTKGFVSDADLAAFRAAGYEDRHAADLCVILAQKTLSNYFNHINDTVLDLPPAPPL